jgi:hypothetical protein
MQEIVLQLIQQGYIVPIVVVGMLTVGVAALAVTRAWHKVRVAELEAALKHKMLEQGMSPAEIERVLGVSATRCFQQMVCEPEPAAQSAKAHH